MIRRALLGLATLFLVSLPAVSQTKAAAPAAAGPSLYKRLGGYDAIAAVSDDFVVRLVSDKQIGRFLIGLSDSSKARLRQNFVDFVCQATGGPCVYVGRDMKTVHKGIGITAADWDLSVKLFIETLDKFKVPQKEKDELLAAVSSLKADIVEKP